MLHDVTPNLIKKTVWCKEISGWLFGSRVILLKVIAKIQ